MFVMSNRRSKESNTEPIRVLLVNPEGKIAGAEQSLLLLARFLSRKMKVFAACPDLSPLGEQMHQLRIGTFRIMCPPRRFNLTVVWLFYFVIVNLQLILIIRKTAPVIIHANNSRALLASMLAAFVTRKKIIWHARDLANSASVSKICAFFSCRIIVVSNTVKKSLVDQGINGAVIDLVRNAVEIKEQRVRPKDKHRANVLTFANIGQFVPWKKQDLFIDAAAGLLQNGSEARFMIIGDDIFGRDTKYKKELLSRVKTAACADKIQFVGWHEDLEQLWDKVDCLVHTAGTEPFGRVIIEAMSRWIPVIAANSCGPAEIIQNGITGLLFEPGDVKDLITVMQKISGDAKLAGKLVEAAHRYVESNFKAEDTADKITEIYKNVLAA